VVVRERHSTRDGEAVIPGTGSGASAPAGGSSTAEADYQVGRRVEQLSVASGTVKRMTVAVVVKKVLSEEQRVHLREVVALAAGYNPARGDAIVVTTLDSLVPAAGAQVAAVPAAAPAPLQPAPPLAAEAPGRGTAVAWVLAALIALTLAGAAGLRGSRRRRTAPVRRLTAQERAMLASEVRDWIGAAAPVAAERK
jgi:flagellar M-ring protein FliF